MLVLTDTETVTEPEPVPELPLLMLRKLLLLEAVHVQVAPLVWVTVKVRVPPLAATVTLPGLTLNAHGTTGESCDTLTVRPATVSVPDRCEVPECSAMPTVTEPAPVPELPLVTVRNGVLLTAVQLQVPPAVWVTVSVRVVAGGGTTIGVGPTSNRQSFAA